MPYELFIEAVYCCQNQKSGFLIAFICLLISSCTPQSKLPDTEQVRMIFYNEVNIVTNKAIPACEYIGTIFSSEGHWYDYLFMSNTDLALGAYNDMHNKTNKVGANIVYINNNIDFSIVLSMLKNTQRMSKYPLSF